MNQPRCILCDENTIQDWFVRSAGAHDYPIVRCESCKSAYVWPRPTESAVEDIYGNTGYSPDHDRTGLYWPSGRNDAARLIKSFGPLMNGKVLLDVGAGAGVASEEAIRRGFIVRACEPSPQCQKEFLNRNGFEPDPSFFDQEYAINNRQQADSVLLSHVLEHLPNPGRVLHDVRSVLRPRGVVMIAVPLFGSVLSVVMGKRDFFITPPEHLTFFSHAGLVKLLRRNGFSVEAMFTSPKVNMLRYRNRLGFACFGVNMAAYGLLKLSEAINRSIVLNVCARLR